MRGEADLPGGWTRSRFEDLVENLDGRRVPVRSGDRAERPGPYPYYGASGVIDHVDGYLFEGDHLLVAEDGANLLSRSTPIAFKARGQFWVNNHAHVVRPLVNAPIGYLESFLNSLDLAPFVTGSAQPKLTQKALNGIDVPTAPVAEQHRIVAKLETLQARSRRAREALDAVPPLLEKLRQSILAAAFRGDLTKDWRAQNPDVEPASELLKRIRVERRKKWEEAELAKLTAKGKAPSGDAWKAKYKEPEPVDTDGLPELPGGWCWSTFDALADVDLGRQRAPQYQTGRFTKPYLRVANIKDDRIDFEDVLEMDFDEEDFEHYALRAGDILLSEGQSPEKVGQSAIYDGRAPGLCYQKTLHRFRSFPSGPTPRFAQLLFRHYVRSGTFRSVASLTTNIAHLTLVRLKALHFPVPPKQEELELVRLAHQALDRVDSLERSVGPLRGQVQGLDRSLLAKAFRGELVPQDPTDEPAATTLARLRAAAPDAAPRRGKARVPGGKGAR